MTIATSAPRRTPLPEVRGPLPDTDSQGQLVWNVSKLGYVAEEYLVSGAADVYEPTAMADATDVASRDTVRDLGRREFELHTVATGRPFTTRLVVYRPRDAARFSGNVIVEPFHTLGGGIGVVWNSIHGFFIANGDAYVGFQHPLTIAGLKRSALEHGDRYGELSMDEPTQLWDALAQTAALLKSGERASPLHGYAVRSLVMTGVSFTGVATSTFVNFHHQRQKTDDGRNLFDGYVSMENATYDRPIDVPVIKLNTQGDFDSFGGLANRRQDGDELGQQYRLYEIAGLPHVTAPRPAPGPRAEPPARLGGAAESEAIGEWLKTTAWAQFPAEAQPNDFPGFAFTAGAFCNLYAWLRGERTPPRAERIETHPDGSTHCDGFGNAQGGVRSPYVDVPIAKYAVGHGYPGFLFGYKVPFALDQRRALYATHASYVARVRTHTMRLLSERWIMEDAARAIIDEAEQSDAF
jgi:hypothetical protein